MKFSISLISAATLLGLNLVFLCVFICLGLAKAYMLWYCPSGALPFVFSRKLRECYNAIKKKQLQLHTFCCSVMDCLSWPICPAAIEPVG